jgi:GDP-D-mannose dehydratase
MHTVRKFATLSFAECGIELKWEGKGVDEKGIDIAIGKVLVEVDQVLQTYKGRSASRRSYKSQNSIRMESN